jgi:segregation and condensation protein B
MTDQVENSDENEHGGGLSLTELTQAFAQAMAKGNSPYGDATGNDDENEVDESAKDVDGESDQEAAPSEEQDRIPINPTTILEAILFVGTPDNQVVKATRIASLMRGVREDELDELVNELNAQYEKHRSAFRIVSESGGFRMVLHRDYESVRNTFYGAVKGATLNQAAIDTLSIVAYRQGIDKDEIEKIRGKPSGSVLSQLVRRALLQVEYSDDKPRKKLYRTTNRFLEVYGLESLDELPQQLEFED